VSAGEVKTICYICKISRDEPGESWCSAWHKPAAHNPDQLTPEQVGVSDGYRLLDVDEIKDRQKMHIHIEARNKRGGYWLTSYRSFGNDPQITYRTRLTREQLAKLK